MLHKASRKIAGQARQASFAGEDFHVTMCHRQTRWHCRTLPRRLASSYSSSNFKPGQSGPCLVQLIPRAVFNWQACYRSHACQANAHLDLDCIGQESLWSGAAKPLQGQLASRRDTILLGHCVCRSFNNVHWQNWLTGPGPAFFRKFCVAWAYSPCGSSRSACSLQL